MNYEDSEIDEPTTQEDHADVAGNGEPSKEEETLVNTAAIGVGGSNDHKLVLSGSGIYPDEVELDKDWYQKDEGVPEAELSKEYLKMGGEFCLDEDEGDKEPGKSACSPTKTLNEPAHGGVAEASISPNVATDLVVAVSHGNNEDEDGTRPVSYLSSIPNLRRKRKKV